MSDNIHSALLTAYRVTGYVQKTGRNTTQNYNFASEADMIRMLRPALVEAGVTFHCSAICDVNRREIRRLDKQGKERVEFNTTGLFEFTFTHGASGTSLTAYAMGEGTDSGDKSSNKAMTAALKYALRQTLLIETGDDPDEHSPEEIVADAAHPLADRVAWANDQLVAEIRAQVREIAGWNASQLRQAREWLKEAGDGMRQPRAKVLENLDPDLLKEVYGAIKARAVELGLIKAEPRMDGNGSSYDPHPEVVPHQYEEPQANAIKHQYVGDAEFYIEHMPTMDIKDVRHGWDWLHSNNAAVRQTLAEHDVWLAEKVVDTFKNRANELDIKLEGGW